MNPTASNHRIYELDYIRGFALLGIIFLNVSSIIQVPFDFSLVEVRYQKFLDIFIESKFMSIFSFLFGVGFYIFINRAKAKSEHPYVIYLRRIVILALLGLGHMQLQPGEVLLVYAIFGLVLLPLFKVNKWVNFAIGMILLCVAIGSGGKILMPLPLFTLGLTFAQFGLHQKMYQHRKYYAIIALLTMIISVIGIYYLNQIYVGASYQAIKYTGITEAQYLKQYALTNQLILILSPIMTICYFSVLVTLLQYKVVQQLLKPLRTYGQMALTNYIGQTLLILLFSYGFGLSDCRLIHTANLCLIILVIQLIFSSLWLSYFKYGPLEYLWKIGTYFKMFPIK
ncbi:DUF418 domain-containing protein [Mammaliicoccus sciuri]|uniref:DUF418 domain-containing protein n=1 Tax=Mammaliicoccus sciuri TaxID=1296 RepID=UPI002B257EB6|nr:DUF418 domain-containing protein [Mammaliicoccus sciuri]WQK60233.1 DUF418 domain-containing protein [Mammaliicoccus sciuri]WQK62979.1 DUF418 domain-containing protein [Mammaliicoccus sciuri]